MRDSENERSVTMNEKSSEGDTIIAKVFFKLYFFPFCVAFHFLACVVVGASYVANDPNMKPLF